MQTFTYEFDELPLAIHDGIDAGQINGSVEIEYNRYGDWDVISGTICLEGYKRITQAERNAGKKPWVYVPAPADISRIISWRLQHEWHDRVTSAVSDQMERDCEAAADDYADMRRDDRMGAF